MDTQKLMADLVADNKAYLERMAQRRPPHEWGRPILKPKVWLIYLNAEVVGVFGSHTKAQTEAATLRNCYAGPWEEVTSDNWTSALVPLLRIEEREVV